MFTGQNAMIAAIGGGAALVGRHGDHSAATSGWGNEETCEPGNIVGNFAVQTGAAFLTYGIGRMATLKEQPDAELFRAQLVSQGTAQALKFAASRTRPDGSDDHSFPSGHSASAFATATVLQKEFGWKAGIPAFAVAGWVAASRVQMQRHYLSDVIAGATVGILAGLTSLTIGIVVGALAGYYGGIVDSLLMRMSEFFQIIPRFFLAILIVALLGGGLEKTILVIGGLSWPAVARIIRAQFLSLREREMVEAARAIGFGHWHIIVREILPNALAPAIVQPLINDSESSLEQRQALPARPGARRRGDRAD
jgi:ABC-type amino acid transport system permease subunit